MPGLRRLRPPRLSGPLVLAAAATVSLTPAASADTPTTGAAETVTAASLQRDALSSRAAFGFVQSLCDTVGPRLAGSPGDRAAVAWGLRTMQAAGLGNVHAEPVKVTHWERGEARAEILGASPRPMVVAALGGSVATLPGGITAGVVEAASLAELQKLGADAVRGKIVFLDPIMRRARDGSGYGEAVPARAMGARVAQSLGAVAVLLRSVGTDHDRIAHTGGKRKDDHEIPAAAISVPDAETLHRVLERDATTRVRLVLSPRTLPDADSADVVGEVAGREHPGEIVLIGAHLDSWDLGTGAIDDGAGVAIALETGRLIAALPQHPRRTVRVVLFANEEHGLEGAKTYAKVHAGELAAHVIATEADFGADAVYAVQWRGDPATRDRFAALARSLAPLGIERDDGAADPGADVTPLVQLGVPVLELRQDGSRYFDIHHTANDTLDKIDPPTLARAAAAFATAVWTAAEMDGDFGRVPEGQRKTR
jgi:carboxypeptidase Q